MGRMMVLKELLARHAKEHESRMGKLKEAMQKKLSKVKKEHQLLASKHKKIMENLLESEERLERLARPQKLRW